MSATELSIIEKFTLTSANGENEVDISQGIGGEFFYYEDIFSPVVTGKTIVMDSGTNQITSEEFKDPLMSGLPVVGGEKADIVITNQREQTLNLKTLRVFKAAQVMQQNNNELISFNFISNEHFINSKERVFRKLPENVTTENVRSILETELKTDKPFLTSSCSSNFSYQGNSRKPFTVIMKMCPRSIGEESGKSAGFVFFETRRGYNFKSIESLIKQPTLTEDGVKVVYTYGGTADTQYEPKNPYGTQLNPNKRILKYSQIQANDLVKKTQYGAYGAKTYNLDPVLGSMETGQGKVNFDWENIEDLDLLGKETYQPPEDLDLSMTRIYMNVNDKQSLTDRESLNFTFSEFTAQAPITYNKIFTQVLNIVVPQNLNLHAGDCIEVNISKIGCQYEFDKELSGKYLIKELCHHFASSRSYSHLLIIRDTLGA
tara:strand:+ start:195 stop:1487 length:1293 start_codon:yes stop_codon:yes gene_type:complete